MDLYPYLDFFDEYLPFKGFTNFPKLNDLDLIIDVDDETHIEEIVDTLNMYKVSNSGNVPVIHGEILSKVSETRPKPLFELNYEIFNKVFSNLSFVVVYNKNLNKKFIKGSVKSDSGKWNVFLDINPILPSERDNPEYSNDKYLKTKSKFSITHKKELLQSKIELVQKPLFEPPPIGLGFTDTEHANNKITNWNQQIQIIAGILNPDFTERISQEQIERIYAIIITLYLFDKIGLGNFKGTNNNIRITGGFAAHLYSRSKLLDLDFKEHRKSGKKERIKAEKDLLKTAKRETELAQAKARAEIKEANRIAAAEEKRRQAAIARKKAEQKKSLKEQKAKEQEYQIMQKKAAKEKKAAKGKKQAASKQLSKKLKEEAEVVEREAADKALLDAAIEERGRIPIMERIQQWVNKNKDTIISSGIQVFAVVMLLYMIYSSIYPDAPEYPVNSIADAYIFNEYDTDETGTIDQTEFDKYIRAMVSPKVIDLDPKYISTLYDEHDLDKDGYISPQEFSSYYPEVQYSSQPEGKYGFLEDKMNIHSKFLKNKFLETGDELQEQKASAANDAALLAEQQASAAYEAALLSEQKRSAANDAALQSEKQDNITKAQLDKANDAVREFEELKKTYPDITISEQFGGSVKSKKRSKRKKKSKRRRTKKKN